MFYVWYYKTNYKDRTHKSQSQLNWVELVALYLIYHFSALILSQNLTWMVLPSSVLIDKFSWTKLMFYLMFTTPIPSSEQTT